MAKPLCLAELELQIPEDFPPLPQKTPTITTVLSLKRNLISFEKVGKLYVVQICYW